LTFHPLEHHVLKGLKGLSQWTKKPFYLLVSGGMDSMALLSVFGRLKSYFKGPLRVVHFHHGPSSDPRVQIFREQAQRLVAQRAQVAGLEFLCLTSPKALTTEMQFRQFRRQELQRLSGVLVTAHHSDDELETHILKLIRGGSSLSLQNFKEWNGRLLRPFLGVPKAKLRSYAKDRSLAFIEDPTNTDVKFLRNWIRHFWLPELEKKSPGGTVALGRSLKTLLQEAASGSRDLFKISSGNVVFRSHFRSLSKDQSHVFLFRFLKTQFPQDYFSHGHIEEVRKNLDKVQKQHTFRIGPFEWKVNAEQIQVRKLDS
jgi:tRNA(Ile)-lysidine synthase